MQFDPRRTLSRQGQVVGKEYVIERLPTEREIQDMIFGWAVEQGVTSNIVYRVKDGCTRGYRDGRARPSWRRGTGGS